MTIKLIVGLRNPGPSYVDTRHNAGAWMLEALSNQSHLSFKLDKKFHGEVAETEIGNQTCKLILPTTFMNHSGRSVSSVTQFYRINMEEILVLHDDLDLPVGAVRLKKGGGHGGHNGLRDIIQHMGSQEFYRLRIGIGHPGPGNNDLVVNYVLGKPSRVDREEINVAIERALSYLPMICMGDFNQAMNQLNTKES